MRKYNGLRGLHRSTVILTVLVAACSSAPERRETYPLTVPPQDSLSPDGSFRRGAPEPGVAATTGGPELRADAPMQYTVKRGDTLWDIAGRFLMNHWEWPEIWVVNQQVRNPHLIYPGDVLTLVWVDGRPRIVRGETSIGGVDKLSPTIRSSSLEDAIPTIPIDAIRDFLSSPRLVTREQIKKAPYLLEFVDPHLIGGAGHQVYIKNLPTDGRTEYDLVRMGDRYVDPQTGQTLGWEGLPVGRVEIRQYGSPGVGMLVDSEQREARRGDHLLPPQAEVFDANFYPHAPKKPVGGRVLSLFDGMSSAGQYQVIAINRGALDGIEPGHVLSVLQANRAADDPYSAKNVPLPDAYAARVLVFKVESRVSYALVMSAVREVRKLDKVEKPRSSDR